MSSINFTSPYRVQGTVNSVAELVKAQNCPGIQKRTEAQINEGKAWEEQTRLRNEAVKRYADAHPNPIIGQVLVGGKVFATVFSPGGVEMAHALPGLSDAQLSPEDRLAEIARAVRGEIKLSDFLPTLGGRYSTIPDEVAATFPKVTARPLGGHLEMTSALEQEMQQAVERARMTRAAEADPKAE